MSDRFILPNFTVKQLLDAIPYVNLPYIFDTADWHQGSLFPPLGYPLVSLYRPGCCCYRSPRLRGATHRLLPLQVVSFCNE